MLTERQNIIEAKLNKLTLDEKKKITPRTFVDDFLPGLTATREYPKVVRADFIEGFKKGIININQNE